MKKIIALSLAVTVTASLAVTAAAPLTDMVEKSHWAYQSLCWSIDNNILTGFDDNTIRPEDKLTRAQLAAVMVRLHNDEKIVPSVTSFPDVADNSWYYDCFVGAYALGLFSGDDDMNMRPDENITRQETFAVISREAGLTASDGNTVFSDDAEISHWAKPFVLSLQEKGFVSGNEDNLIQPLNEITRAEFAQLIYNVKHSDMNIEKSTPSPMPTVTATPTATVVPTPTPINTIVQSGGSHSAAKPTAAPSVTPASGSAEVHTDGGDNYMDDIFE